MKRKKVSQKKQVCITLDNTLYLQIINKDINLSQTINTFLHNFLDTKKYKNQDIEKIEKEIEDAKKEIEVLTAQIIELNSVLMHLKNTELKEQQSELQDAIKTADALHASDWINTDEADI